MKLLPLYILVLVVFAVVVCSPDDDDFDTCRKIQSAETCAHALLP